MINLTRIWTGQSQPADRLRYGRGHGSPASAASRRPVVVWNITRTCNLHCVHCYTDSDRRDYPGELTSEECTELLQDLAAFGVPALLLSGGEPTVHPRFFAIAKEARSLGLRLTLSTNGTRIDLAMARRLKEIGFGYVGISLDGMGPVHDQFRGKVGAFDLAVRAFRACKEVDQKCGLRLTLTPQTVKDLDRILDFIETESIPRACFYHLVPSGRGQSIPLLPAEDTRQALRTILGRISQWESKGRSCEILTVDQPADAVFVMNEILKQRPSRFDEARELLGWNGGGHHSSGTGIANIDACGNVHPDQFWQDYTIGNIRNRPFSECWSDPNEPLLSGLRNRGPHLTGRCRRCVHVGVCGGGFRARARKSTGDCWAEDPGCYLSEEEILTPTPTWEAGSAD